MPPAPCPLGPDGEQAGAVNLPYECLCLCEGNGGSSVPWIKGVRAVISDRRALGFPPPAPIPWLSADAGEAIRAVTVAANALHVHRDRSGERDSGCDEVVADRIRIAT